MLSYSDDQHSFWGLDSLWSKQESVFRAEPIKEIVLDGLIHPWSICFLSEEDVLISEKDGVLIRADLTDGSRIKIKGFPSDLVDSIRIKDHRDNSGIFEVIKDPAYISNQKIYISYAAESDSGFTTKIISAILAGDQLRQIQTIFIADPFSYDLFHYGGGMVFGTDGKLYCTIGERLYNERDEPELPIVQDVTDKRGKIYRVNGDGTIPEDNPDFGALGQPGLFAIGIRAAQGIAVNPIDSTIWFSEHGSTQGDELNLLEAGANYGWPIRTSGRYRNEDYTPVEIDNAEFVEPKHYWLQTIAPTGLTFYTGSGFPSWYGDIILPGLSRGSLWRIRLENQQVVSVEELFIHDRIRARKAAVSPAGRLYLLTDERNGKLIEITNQASNANP